MACTRHLRPSHDIDPSKLAVVERGDLARVVVATGKIQPLVEGGGEVEGQRHGEEAVR